jgi:hypothetical protein
MIGMSVETHKTSPDFDQKKCNQAKSRIVQALGDIDCDVFIEKAEIVLGTAQAKASMRPAR